MARGVCGEMRLFGKNEDLGFDRYFQFIQDLLQDRPVTACIPFKLRLFSSLKKTRQFGVLF